MTVSIIIAVKKRNKNLDQCIRACLALDYPDYEIFLSIINDLLPKTKNQELINILIKKLTDEQYAFFLCFAASCLKRICYSLVLYSKHNNGNAHPALLQNQKNLRLQYKSLYILVLIQDVHQVKLLIFHINNPYLINNLIK